MKKTILFAAFGVAFALFSCKNEPAKPALPPLVFSIQNQSWKGAAVAGPKADTAGAVAEVSAAWPVASGGSQQAAEGINGAVERFAASMLHVGEGEPLQRIGPAAAAFIEAFRAARKENPEEFAWGAQIDGKSIFQSKKTASVEVAASNFTGGAHGGAASLVASFDLADGHRLRAAEILTDTAAVVPLVAAAFAKAKDAKDVKEVIYPDAKFILPANVAVVAAGVRFAYDPYEIAPWAVGPTDILLTWAELGKAADKSKFLD